MELHHLDGRGLGYDATCSGNSILMLRRPSSTSLFFSTRLGRRIKHSSTTRPHSPRFKAPN